MITNRFAFLKLLGWEHREILDNNTTRFIQLEAYSTFIYESLKVAC